MAESGAVGGREVAVLKNVSVDVHLSTVCWGGENASNCSGRVSLQSWGPGRTLNIGAVGRGWGWSRG